MMGPRSPKLGAVFIGLSIAINFLCVKITFDNSGSTVDTEQTRAHIFA